MTSQRLLVWMWVVVLLLTAWSGYRPSDYGVWAFELVLGWLGIIALTLTIRRFRFSRLVYVLVCVHFAILAAGAKYTYAEMPLFDWIRDTLGLARNHYDRVGHFAQGFVPAMILREVLIRLCGLRRGAALGLICIGLCLGISAFYELIEWWVVLIFYPTQGQEWLGMQGDAWDAQWDMCMALLGATSAILLLRRLHDRSMQVNQANQERCDSSPDC